MFFGSYLCVVNFKNTLFCMKLIDFNNSDTIRQIYNLTINQYLDLLFQNINDDSEYRTVITAQERTYELMKDLCDMEVHEIDTYGVYKSKVYELHIPCVGSILFKFIAKRINNIAYIGNKIKLLEIKNYSKNLDFFSLNRKMLYLLKDPFELSPDEQKQLLFIRQSINKSK